MKREKPQNMKAYEFKVQGEKEIVSGHSELDALKFYVNFIGISLDEVDEIQEIPSDSWDSIVNCILTMKYLIILLLLAGCASVKPSKPEPPKKMSPHIPTRY